MPAKVKVRILAGRNLPVMDKSSDASDAFVEVKLGNTTYKTEVYRRSLNPFWNSEWFRFEVSDQELQDEPLQIRIMDYDTYSANDAIGKVYINLNPLLLNPGRSMNGWLPIYDTLHGIRGEINCMVKVNLFADNNRFRHSSCGVRFFFSDIPNGYKCDAVLGFVDELLVNDDPEYQWIDKIRTPRASNEARQTLFTKLSGEVQRKLGLKAEIFGGNAVIGYQQSFDLEGGSGIVGRGIGTAVILSRIEHNHILHNYPGESAIEQSLHLGGLYGIPQISTDKSHYLSPGFKIPSQSERQLVHSVSADYFYEVPKKIPNKKLSNAHETVTAKLARDISDSSDAGDTFVSFKSHDENGTSTSEDDDRTLDSDLDDIFSTSKAHVRQASSKRHGQLTKSLSLINANELLRKSQTPIGGGSDSSTSRRMQFYIGKYLRHRTQELNQRLHELTKPVVAVTANTTSAVKLIKFLSNRKTANQNLADNASASTNKKHRPASTSAAAGTALESPPQQRTTSSQPATSAESYTNPSGASSSKAPAPAPPATTITSGSVKRRRDKGGQAAGSSSLDDALSIIEEKLDDDAEQQNQQLLQPGSSDSRSPQMRARLTSTSSSNSNRTRQLTRAKEIDLSDELSEQPEIRSSSDLVSDLRATRLSTSSAEDEDDIDNSAAKSSETISSATMESFSTRAQAQTISGSRSPPCGESLLSTSSPSSSLLTDETIKAKKPESLGGVPSKSDRIEVPTLSLHKSDTDLAHAPHLAYTKAASLRDQDLQQSKHAVDAPLVAGPSHTRSESSSRPPKRSNPMGQEAGPARRQQHQASKQRGANFAQSVGVIKAQQHLLQNMIKHQNQNLVVNSMNKARSALVYPGRIHQSEYPFVTLKRFPEGLIQCTGGVVSVHSVKLLDHIINDEESETRDNWWTEIRKEIRSHAKSLNCNTILGYTETSKVLGDVCILSARGTAAILRPLDQMMMATGGGGAGVRERTGSGSNHQQALKLPRLSTSPQPHSIHASMPPAGGAPQAPSPSFNDVGTSKGTRESSDGVHKADKRDGQLSFAASSYVASTGASAAVIDCSFCHTPLHCVESIASLADCSICCSNKVPDVLLLTIEPPKSLNIVSSCSLVQARVCRTKRDSHGEASAKEIGDALPFLEYELHRQLFSKLKFKGMNCLFNLKIDISVGENLITGVATGTGCFVLGLPTPDAPMISAGKGIKATKLNEIQRLIALTAARNRDLIGLSNITRHIDEYHRQIGIVGLAAGQQSAVSDGQRQQVSGPAGGSQDCASASQTIPKLGGASQETTTSTDATSRTFKSDDSAMTAISFERNKKLATAAIQQVTNHNNKHHKHHHSHHHHHHHHHHHNHHHHHKKSPRSSNRYQSRASGSLSQPTENLVSMLGDENNIILEVDDNEDADIIALLIDSDTPQGYMICNSEIVPTIKQEAISSINMFTQVMRVKLNASDQFAQQFDLILQTLYVKLRRSLPCCLTNLNFVVDLPESHIVQITVTGCMLGLDYAYHVGGPPSPGASHANMILDGEQTIHSIRSAPDNLASVGRIEEGRAHAGRHGGSHKKKSSKATYKMASSTSMSPTSTTSAADPSTSSSKSKSSSVSSQSGSSNKAKSSSSSDSSSSSSDSSSSSCSNNSTVSLNDGGKKRLPAIASGLLHHQAAGDEKQEVKSKPPGKSSSGSNLAALISAGKSTLSGVGRRAKAKNLGGSTELELAEQKQLLRQQEKQRELEYSNPTTKSAIAAIKQEILLNKLGQEPEGESASRKATVRKMLRPVFKKQLTYPGASSPAISGQDDVIANQQQQLPTLNELNSAAIPTVAPGGSSTQATQQSGSSTARKQAAALLNKVKQPFKDLGSNFNSSPAGPTGHGQFESAQQHQHVSHSGSFEMNSIHESRQASKRTSSRSGSGLLSRPIAPSTSQETSISNSSKALPTASSNQRRSSASGATSPALAARLSVTKATAKDRREPRSLNSSIDITSLSYIPGAKGYLYLGNLSFSFVRETNSVRENGGLNGFIHCFLMEVYAIVRAHVSALGGNAFLSFRLQQSCIFYHSNKNQAQCLISVAGDAVQVTTSM